MFVKHAATMLVALFVGLAWAAPLHAQGPLFRFGGGAAVGSGAGLAGLVSVEGRFGLLVARAEARPVYHQGVQEGGYAGGGIGLAARPGSPFGQPYILATVARGIDVREADWATGVGLALGSDFGRRLLGGFMELHYEHAEQDRPIYYRLPSDQLTAVVGVRVGRR